MTSCSKFITRMKFFSLSVLALLIPQTVSAAGFDRSEDGEFKSGDFVGMSSQLPKNEFRLNKADFINADVDMSADSYEYVGANLIVKGHVVVRVKNMQLTADSAVVNMLTKDMEAAGNVTFSCFGEKTESLLPEDYEKILEDPRYQVTVLGYTASADGRMMINAKIRCAVGYMKAQRATGNVDAGSFQFRDFLIKAGTLYCSGKFAERYPDGKIKMYDSKVTTCEYELDGLAHYAIGSKESIIRPRSEANRSMYNYNPNHSDHSVFGKNNLFYLWDIPVFWLPYFYKPADPRLLGFRFEVGSSTRWGFYIRTMKDFTITTEPVLTRASLMVDYYADRGMGGGVTADFITDRSKTELFAYYIHDRSPYDYWDYSGDFEKWLYSHGRFEIPKNRYELRLSNMTHITSRLDFRGQLDIISDYNFLQDYFSSRYNENEQPPSFASLEYQGDHFSANLRMDFKVNSFDSTMMRLPELRFDFQRQELFKNIYYQGQTSAGYYYMSFRKPDFVRTDNPSMNLNGILAKEGLPALPAAVNNWINDPNISADTKRRRIADVADYLKSRYPQTQGYFDDPKDYRSFRFDTLHALYYPFKLFEMINIIPRAAGRLTAYSNSSDNKVDDEDLYTLFGVQRLDGWANYLTKINNYDRDGGAKFRFAGELGAEINTKIYRSWQSPKSAFWQMDGLRHVAVPYLNYTYIPKPTVDYRNLYYFDEVDQLEEQNFMRMGIVNRLQTRRNDMVTEWFSMENYWDFHFQKTDGFNNIGDFGTTVRISPLDGLTFFTDLLLDVGKNNAHDAQAIRNGEPAGRPGISSDLINRFNIGFNYKINKDWQISMSYRYTDAYADHGTYSMASTLARISSSTMSNSYYQRSQTIDGAISFPTYIDKNLKGVFSLSYDIDADRISSATLSLIRNFHCWYVMAGFGVESDYSSNNGDYKKEYYFKAGISVGLTAMPQAAIGSNLYNGK